MKQKLETFLNKALEQIEKAQNSNDLEQIKLEFLSRNSELNAIKKNLKDLSIEDKKIIGSLANTVTKQIEDKLTQK